MSIDAALHNHYQPFSERLAAHLTSEGYRFSVNQGGLTSLSPGSTSTSISNLGLSGAILAGPLFAGTAQSNSEDELHQALTDLQPLCLTAACKIKSGFVYVVALINADGLSDQQIVGTCALLNTKLQSFKRFSTPAFNTW